VCNLSPGWSKLQTLYASPLNQQRVRQSTHDSAAVTQTTRGKTCLPVVSSGPVGSGLESWRGTHSPAYARDVM
jgi:hypothetical protein